MIRTDVRLGWKSIPGHRHRIEGRENEDAVLLTPEHPYFDALMLIADGMGGHPEPRLAAQTAAAAARDFLLRPERVDEVIAQRVAPMELLCGAVEQANRQVRRLASQAVSPSLPVTSGTAWEDEKPPGCTLTIAGIADGRLSVAHVGDGSAFLLRNGVLRLLAGGEARRRGNRPDEFLGRAEQIDVETTVEEIRAGDRLLLCTDGLTRYFGEGGRLSEGRLTERLQKVIARAADPQTLASQLTADGRGEEYDDDTSVVVAEVGASREAPEPRRMTPEAPMAAAAEMAPAPRGRPHTQPRGVPAATAVFLVLLGAVLTAAGMFGWRTWRQNRAGDEAPLPTISAAPAELSGFPLGGVLLVSPENGRFFVVRTRPKPLTAAGEPMVLRQLWVTPSKGVKDSGIDYRLDVKGGRLIAPNGRKYPVTIDLAAGTIQLQQTGTVHLNIRPSGLPVWIDGLNAGTTPLTVSARAGQHDVQVRTHSNRQVLLDFSVEIPPNGALTYSQEIALPSQTRASGG